MRRRIVVSALSLIAMPLAAQIPPEIQSLIDAGEFTQAREQLATAAEGAGPPAREALLFEAERLRRVALDFEFTAEQMLERVQRDIPDATLADIDRWREEGHLQSFVIDGIRRYFPRDARALVRHSEEARQRREAALGLLPPSEEGSDRLVRFAKQDAPSLLEQHVQRVIEAARGDEDGLVLPHRYRATYTLTVNPGQVPPGETIRAWLPFPREEPQQTGIALLSTDPDEHILAPPDAPQRTLYLERPAAASGEPTVFRAQWEFTTSAFHREIDPATVEPHDPGSEEFQRFTAEVPPHIVFTPEIVAITQEAVGDETNPYLKARRIYDWINDNIRYIGEREYSTIPNISALCLERRAGDCGVQTLLFITMCRAAGVPARWESGWQTRPGALNLHDWGRFHVEPHGWLWADPSYGHHPDWEGEAAQRFYFGNIDAYRMVVNSDYSQPLIPPKEHFRSETVDFQRGEVEWAGGNLYFDQWDYHMDLEVLSGGSAD